MLFVNCSGGSNSSEFITQSSGRYLFNSNEVLEIYFKEKVLFVKWRGSENIRPLKVNDSTFYIKEMNEKIHFISQPEMHIKLAEKREHEGKKYSFRKLAEGEMLPSEYLKNKQFDKALEAYLDIRSKDSLDQNINEWELNTLGYNYIRKKDFENAIQIFKINVALYPESSNVYDSLGEAYLLNRDTINAIENYEKSLDLNFDNRNAERALKKIKKK